MELRHDWASFEMTPELFKHVFMKLIPDVIFHSQGQDEEQVRDHYDRKRNSYLGLNTFLNVPRRRK